MKNVLAVLVVGISGLSVMAQNTNYCEYGSIQQGVTRFEFVERNLPVPRYQEYNAVINDQIKVSVTKRSGHLVTYAMVVNYKDGEVMIEDEYTDYAAPFRYLNIFARFNGLNLACYFKPDLKNGF